MILDIIKKDYIELILQLQAVMVTWAIVVLAIGVDLYYGIKKSRESGMFTHSYGLRRTSSKTVQYLSFMLFMLFFDVLNVFWVYVDVQKLPIASLFGAIVLVYTEAKSVKEKMSDKFRKTLAEHPAEIIQFVKDNRHLIKEISKQVKKDKDEKDN